MGQGTGSWPWACEESTSGGEYDVVRRTGLLEEDLGSVLGPATYF